MAGKRKYDNSHRQEIAALRATIKRLEAVRAAERKERKRGGRPRSERRAERRAAALPKNRRCPTCGELKLGLKQWEVLDDGQSQCMTCARDPERSYEPEKAKAYRHKLALARQRREMKKVEDDTQDDAEPLGHS